MNQLIWYPKCSTCQNAKQQLEQLGFELSFRDIKEDKLNESELKNLIELSGLEIKKFFNTSGLKYKELQLKDKLPEMSDVEKIKLLASDGMLVKRPILVANNRVVVGRKLKEYEEIANQ